MDSFCAPLLLRSNCSLLTGTAELTELIKLAQHHELRALALTDRNNLYGAIPFYHRAREADIKPIIGTELTTPPYTAVVLAQNATGYMNLCRLLSRRNLKDDFSLPEALTECQQGLHVLTENVDLARTLCEQINQKQLWLLLCHPRPLSHQRNIRQCARQTGIAPAATPDVYFPEESDRPLHLILAAIRDNTVISDLSDCSVAPPGSRFMSPDEIRETFADTPAALENTAHILRDCNCEIPLGDSVFPTCSTPDDRSALEYLKQLCRAQIRKMYPDNRVCALQRLRKELAIIDDLGFTEYFLFAREVLQYALRKNIPTIGRGSGAGSIVSYLLGITQVDPLAYNIPFERFLHRRRDDAPDLDVDLGWTERDRLIESIYRRYGSRHVAMVSTHSTFRLRSAFRDVARAHGVCQKEVNRLSAKLERNSDRSVYDAVLSTDADTDSPLPEEKLRDIALAAQSLRGFPRHVGVHCGGLVVGERPLEDYVPLERASKGVVITQYDKDAVEERGLVKMDFLGNHGLTIQSRTSAIINQRGIKEKPPDPIPDDDPATARLLREGRTLGCCQLESPAMRSLLRRLRPHSIRQLMQVLALIRPAPASGGMKDQFIQRARGEAPVEFAHPLLEDALEETRGILLFEDDAMRVASALADVSLEEGDRLRRAISKADSRQRLREISTYFIHKAKDNGVPPRTAAEVWARMAQFNSYSFCRAHAASYAKMAYELAYLKAHHPLPFMTAVLNHQWGMYPRRTHLEEARRMGLKILPPSVNQSHAEFSAETEGIRVGLGAVKELSEHTLKRIRQARKNRPFDSLPDFLSRTNAGKREAENLILAGALDCTEWNRPQLLWGLKALDDRITNTSPGTLFPDGHPLPEPPDLPAYGPMDTLGAEMHALELSVHRHPIIPFRWHLNGPPLPSSNALDSFTGQNIRTMGILTARRTTTTRHGRTMQFLTLEDEHGIFEALLFPQAHQKCDDQLRGIGPYIVEGRVQNRDGVTSINAENIRRIHVNTAGE
ncbi:MAG: DNA polymerase III subunit alpha [Candidatus Brocadiia bacterium]